MKTLEQTIREEMDFFFSQPNGGKPFTSEEFRRYLILSTFKVSRWIEQGHNVESNQNWLDHVNTYLKTKI